MTQKAVEFLIETINYLVRENEIEEALDLMVKEVSPIKDSLSDSITAAYQSYTMTQNDRGIMTNEQYSVQLKIIGRELTKIVKRIKPTLELLQQLKKYKGLYSREIELIVDLERDMVLEKIIGDSSNLININWLVKGIEASKSVCQIRRNGKGIGTGWLLKGGWLMTNSHVIQNTEKADISNAVFNYEKDGEDQDKEEVSYDFELEGALFSNRFKLDYAYLKIKDNPNNPISQWGSLSLNRNSIPAIDDRVTIIQHPDGEQKQIALHQNKVLNVDGTRIFYTTDTLPGSSGSPCFNDRWEVVALHHAGKTENGGLVIDRETEQRAPSNRGVLIEDIMTDIKMKLEIDPADEN